VVPYDSVLGNALGQLLNATYKKNEFFQVLCIKYPSLETVVDKLLDIYFLLSAGGHQGASDVAMETEIESVGKFLSHDGRQISTRYIYFCCPIIL
jgi:hypothetical protein